MRPLLPALLIVAACASSQQSANAPNVQIALAQINSASDTFYFAGPINIQYQLSVTNPTAETITMRRLDLATEGSGAYALRTSGNINLRVPPNSTATTTISAWGRSPGGYLTSSEPVTIRGTAIFYAPNGKGFSRIFMQNLAQR